MRGLTGSIATGKSTVARMLEQLGAVILDSDQIARDAIKPGTEGWHQVKKYFPETIDAYQEIDRKKLGAIIFNNPKQRRLLETIIHPYVINTIQTQGRNLEKNNRIVFADIPLLYETNCQDWLDEVWVVYIPRQLQIERLMLRDDLSKAEAELRIGTQLPIEKKRRLADYVIDNSGSLADTKKQIDKLWYQVLR